KMPQLLPLLKILCGAALFAAFLLWRPVCGLPCGPAPAWAQEPAVIAPGRTIGDDAVSERPQLGDGAEQAPPDAVRQAKGQADAPPADVTPAPAEVSGPSNAATNAAADAAASRPAAASASSASPVRGDKVQLFGTVEFKRPLSSLPGWLDLLKRNGQAPIFIPDKVFRRDVTWGSFKARAPKGRMELLRYVNAFWNTWPYKEDIANWHQQDYWAIPAEFLKKSGDCEDYCIVKYFTLKELGVPPENMRIVVVRDTVRNFAHAVLAVYDNGDAFILDNLSNAVLSHSRLRQYLPQYSVNEFSRWAHLKGRKIR
uniref:transglutaminase-like cysteine peptidase n=1 Tax=uncultured Desulfovibrio sp. TaxID=167968 RepID=UPI003458D2A3